MSGGPPTPPPISATEIQDATRTIVPPLPAAAAAASTSTSAPVAAAAPPPPPREDHYTLIFPEIASLASDKKFVALTSLAERNDIISEDRSPNRLLVIAPLVLAYLIMDDLPPALRALYRLPTNLQAVPLAKQLYALLASTSERKYANVYARVQGFSELVSQPDFYNTSLGALLGLMISTFLDAFRSRTFDLLVKAYTSLPLALAQTYLGLPADEVLAVASKSGWSYDTSTQVLTPQKPTQTASASNVFSPFSTLNTFNAIADSVAKLET
ncbi:COP9 signalosome [Roridomyces roridus]|uniref:COP9 signalosome n=1 Tax=Roridomyces roridus TaxID=1738132 RepID=A0AAD7FR79_9AGAR|nr:COP9 signalosome [Roridomyces roridus]